MDKIKVENISNLIKPYYLDYAMSVIISRALPDVRDGLKPVQRKILYAMSDLNITHDKPYKKSARIIGEVIGKYNPHGDTSAYEAMVKMAQWWSMRNVLIDGHGNYGSMDGDSPAAMRYTEARLSKTSLYLLGEINKDTVDFIPNFDGEEIEPVLLPSRFPNLLINGCSGVAVGFATNIPSHNPIDSINQILYQIDNPECSIEDLVKILKAPDFSTGGSIVNINEMLDMYKDGKGAIVIRGKYKINENTISFYEIPYGVNKLKLLCKLNELYKGYYKEKKDNKKEKEFIKPLIPNITNINDLSDEISGINIEIEVDDKNNIDKILALLFRYSPLQSNFSANFTMLYGEKLIENVSLKKYNEYFINYQKEIITRRSKFELNKALEKQNILSGYVIALANIDEVIKIIKASKSKKDAEINLIKRFGLNEKQSCSILEMQLRRLTNLEIEDIKNKLDEINKVISYLKDILSNEDKLIEIVKKELIEVRDNIGEPRKTDIIYEDNLDISSVTSGVDDYNCRVLLTTSLLKKHLKQSNTHKLKPTDEIIGDIQTNNKNNIYVFTDKANKYMIECNSLQTFTPQSYGESIYTLFPKMLKDEKPICVVSPNSEKGYMLIVFKNGKIAKIDIKSYISNYKVQNNVYNRESDIVFIDYIEKDEDILLVSNKGKGLIINSSDINSKSSKSTKGVKGIGLGKGEVIAYSKLITKEHVFNIITNKREIEYILNDKCECQLNSDERTIYDYISGRCGNKGNNIIKFKKDELIESIK